MKEAIILNNLPNNVTPIFLPIKYRYIDGVLHIYCFLKVLNEEHKLTRVDIGDNNKDTERYVSIDEIEQAVNDNPSGWNTISYFFSTKKGSLNQDYCQKFRCYYNELTEQGFFHIGTICLSLEQLKALKSITTHTTINCHVKKQSIIVYILMMHSYT
jgi:hypothetical protein